MHWRLFASSSVATVTPLVLVAAGDGLSGAILRGRSVQLVSLLLLLFVDLSFGLTAQPLNSLLELFYFTHFCGIRILCELLLLFWVSFLSLKVVLQLNDRVGVQGLLAEIFLRFLSIKAAGDVISLLKNHLRVLGREIITAAICRCLRVLYGRFLFPKVVRLHRSVHNLFN